MTQSKIILHLDWKIRKLMKKNCKEPYTRHSLMRLLSVFLKELKQSSENAEYGCQAGSGKESELRVRLITICKFLSWTRQLRPWIIQRKTCWSRLSKSLKRIAP